MPANNLLSSAEEFTTAEGQPTQKEMEALQAAILSASPAEKASLLAKFEGDKSAELKLSDDGPVARGHDVGLPFGIKSRLKEAKSAKTVVTQDAVTPNVAGDRVSTSPEPKPEITNVAVEDATRGVGHVKPAISQVHEAKTEIQDQQTGKIADFEEIGPNGELQAVKRSDDGDVSTFDAPVGSDVTSVIAETPKIEPTAPSVADDNASRALAAIRGATIADQVRANTDTAPELSPQADDGTSTAETVDADLGNNGNQEVSNSQTAEAATAAVSNAAGVSEEPSVITIDKTPNAQTEGAPVEPPAPNVEQTDMAAATLPPEADDEKYRVPIRRPGDPQELNGGEVKEPVTVYPAHESREAAPAVSTTSEAGSIDPQILAAQQRMGLVERDGLDGAVKEERERMAEGVAAFPQASTGQEIGTPEIAASEEEATQDRVIAETSAEIAEDKTNHQKVASYLSNQGDKIRANDLNALSNRLTSNN